jgi:hypothetical protein
VKSFDVSKKHRVTLTFLLDEEVMAPTPTPTPTPTRRVK